MGVCSSEKSTQIRSNNQKRDIIKYYNNDNLSLIKINDNLFINFRFHFYDFKTFNLKCNSKNGKSLFISKIYFLRKEYPNMTSFSKDPHFFFDINDQFYDIKINDLKISYLEIEILEELNITETDINVINSKIEEHCKKSKIYSIIKINCFTLLYGTKDYDLNLGNKKGRINFKVEINQASNIIVNYLSNDIKKDDKIFIEINNNTFYSKDNNSLNIEDLTINEFKNSYLSIDKGKNNDNISLDNLKNEIIENKGKEILEFQNYIIEKNPKKENTYVNNFNKLEKTNNKGDKLIIENLPFISQIQNYIFTEEGLKKYPYSLYLNIKHSMNKSKNVEYLVIYPNLHSLFQSLKNTDKSNTQKLTIIISDIRSILLKSVSNNFYLYFYDCYEEMKIIIEILFDLINEVYQLLSFSKNTTFITELLELIKNIIQREELDNEILFNIFEKYYLEYPQLVDKYNEYILIVLRINMLIKDKIRQTMIFPLEDIYAIFFYRYQFFRKLIMKAIILDDEIYSNYINSLNNESDNYFYDIYNDKKVTTYLSKNTFQIFDDYTIKPNEIFYNIIDKSSFFYNFSKNLLSRKFTNLNIFPLSINFSKEFKLILHSCINIFQKKNISSLQINFSDLICYYSKNYFLINKLITSLILKTNIYDTLSVFTTFDIIHKILNSESLKDSFKIQFDFTVLEKAVNLIITFDNSLIICKMLWLYYYDSHLMNLDHLKWFVINIINKNYEMFILHWSWKIRFLFFKILFYILGYKIKDKIDVYLDKKIHDYFIEKKEFISKHNELILTEYNTFNQNFINWKEKITNSKYIEYPIVTVLLPTSDDTN